MPLFMLQPPSPKPFSFLHWLDNNILLILGGFLLAFIPLWPKIPLFSPIEQYIVRVRIEDVVLLFTVVVWFVQVIRKKVKWQSYMFWFVLAYAIVGLLSTLSAMFITKTVPLQQLHVEKTVLNYFRYLEYFSFFFVLFSAVKSKKDLWLLLGIFGVTVIAITVYGYGQKYWYWPVYSTMNREFSKGVRLYLTPHARVQSTFAGHYDMAAFLVIALPLLLAFAFEVKNRFLKIFFHVCFWVGTWLIIMSAARSSFIGYLAALVFVVFFSSIQLPSSKRLRFLISRGIFVFGLAGIMFVVFGADLSDRLNQVIDSNQKIHDTFHGLNKQRKELIAAILHQQNSDTNAPTTTPTPPPGAMSTDQAISMGILSPTDEVPETAPKPTPVPAPTTKLPADVYSNPPDIQLVASKSANGTTHYELQEVPRTYSANAIKYGLSMGIRLDTLWPNAIKGFLVNPLLGKGYATLNKTSNDQFTEADSTDGNFFRTLGETGLLGFITFYGCVALVMWVAIKGYRKSADLWEKALSVGMFSASIGLLLNAIYIDVFASSKVALTYWGMAGVFLSYSMLNKVIPTPQLPSVVKKHAKK